MTDMGSRPGMIAVALNAGELLVKASAFLYENSPLFLTGDPDKDLNEEDAKALLEMAEKLLERIEVFPEGSNILARCMEAQEESEEG